MNSTSPHSNSLNDSVFPLLENAENICYNTRKMNIIVFTGTVAMKTSTRSIFYYDNYYQADVVANFHHDNVTAAKKSSNS